MNSTDLSPMTCSAWGHAMPGWRPRSRTTGWRYIFGHRALAALFCNSLIFGGCILLASPLLAVLMLSELGFTPWQYGLALGLPGLGGVVGAMCTRRLTDKYGARRVLLSFGVLRTLWLGMIPLAPAGARCLVVIVASRRVHRRRDSGEPRPPGGG